MRSFRRTPWLSLARQLDLLNNAEAMSRWLRQRHTEQIKLIASVELLVISALRLDHLAAQQPGPVARLNGRRQRLTGIRDECARLRRALEERRPPMMPDAGAASRAVRQQWG